jgi:hypothetical protein
MNDEYSLSHEFAREIAPELIERLAAMRAKLADAWDEGHAAHADGGHWEDDPGRPDIRRFVTDPTPNPYRPTS